MQMKLLEGLLHCILKNLVNHYLPLANEALVLDNSIKGSMKIIAIKGVDLKVEDTAIWNEILEVAHA
jgi:hypothetical protein